jgi:hypothetical protein
LLLCLLLDNLDSGEIGRGVSAFIIFHAPPGTSDAEARRAQKSAPPTPYLQSRESTAIVFSLFLRAYSRVMNTIIGGQTHRPAIDLYRRPLIPALFPWACERFCTICTSIFYIACEQQSTAFVICLLAWKENQPRGFALLGLRGTCSID